MDGARAQSRPGPEPGGRGPGAGTYLYVFGPPEAWSVGPEQVLKVAEGFRYERIDPYETTFEQFAAWVNNEQGGSWTATFWLAIAGDVVTKAARAWDMSGSGECEEPRTLEPINDNCF